MKNNYKKQKGFVLITGMIILIVIAIAAFSSMEITNLDYKMSANSAFKDSSFQASESGRIASGEALLEYAYERTWSGVTIHSGLSKGDSYDPLAANSSSENLYDTSTLIKDLDFNIAETTQIEEVDADIYIVRATSASGAEGSGLQQLAGYRGAGKGAASSGAALYFQIRSKGNGKSGAETITASEFRALIQ